MFAFLRHSSITSDCPNGPDPNVWEHCSANAKGVGLDPVEALNLFLSSFDFIQKPTKIFFSFLQEGTKHMFL